MPNNWKMTGFVGDVVRKNEAASASTKKMTNKKTYPVFDIDAKKIQFNYAKAVERSAPTRLRTSREHAKKK